MQDGERVNSELKEQYNRYRFMFLALCASGFLPLATLVFLYLSGPGLGYLGKHLTTVVVFFVLQVPICAMGGYLLGIRRMRFLERSSQLVAAGETRDLQARGIFKITGRGDYVLSCVDIIDDTGSEAGIERYMIIPTSGSEAVIRSLPELDGNSQEDSDAVEQAPMKLSCYVDSESGKLAAVNYQGTVLFVSPPVTLFI
ncbi:hypothetical protein GC174_03225 [bacterium]|nr:hypothetical protein [bacterium]